MLKQAISFGTALFNLAVRVAYFPFAVFAWLTILAQSWKLLLALFLIGGASIVITTYAGPFASEFFYLMQCQVNVFYAEYIRPIIDGIIHQFFNRIVCWYDGLVMFPYLYGRQVVFPVLREGGFGPTVSAFAAVLSQVGKDVFLDYFFTTRWFNMYVDFTAIQAKWITFWTLWQNLLCYGCNDLCLYFTRLPILVAPFSSNQIKDPQFLCYFSNIFNGIMVVVQQLVLLVREVIYPTQPTLPAPDFSKAFQFWCDAIVCMRRSWENILQETWDTFVPFQFVWRDVLCFWDAIGCAMLQWTNMWISILFNANQVVSHFANIDSTYWNIFVKEQIIEIINRLGTATYFPPISVPIQNTSQTMVITTYQLLTTEQGTAIGTPNPLYGQKTAGECLCIALTRILCDPTDSNITCAQRFNGTLLTGIEPCCFTNALGKLGADIGASLFEFTLHLGSFEDFILYLDQQPFTLQIANDLSTAISCLFQIFNAIPTYGFCIARILSELVFFFVRTTELLYRIALSIIITPVFNAFLPQTCNFIACPASQALDQSLAYLNQISDATDPNGLINCFCFVLNSGFNVPYAGCHNVSCVPGGFIPPTQMKRFVPATTSVYDYATRHLGASRKHAHKITKAPIRFGFDSFRSENLPHDDLGYAFALIDRQLTLAEYGIHKRYPPGAMASRDLILENITTSVVNCTDPMNPPPCFNLCCLPVKLIQLGVHTMQALARALNAAFQTRFTDGSTYWNGQACPDGPCFASDIVEQVVLSVAPLQCLCEFIKLVLPPQGFSDPCCGIAYAGELISVFLQIVINVGNSVAGGGPDFYYIRGNQTTAIDPSMTNGTATSSGIPLVDDFTVLLSIALDTFDCLCDFIKSIFQVALTGFNVQAEWFNPCCMVRVYFRAILQGTKILLKTVLSLTNQKSIYAQQYLYVNGYANARPYSSFFIGGIGIVQDTMNLTQLLFAPPVKDDALMTCAALLPAEAFEPDREGLPTCFCNLASSVLTMINQIEANFKGDFNATSKCIINLCCPIFAIGRVYKEVIDFLIQFVATIWQNWEYKANITIVPGQAAETFFIPQETVNFFFCDEYAGYNTSDMFAPDGITPNPFFSESYLSIAMSQVFYSLFVQNKPNYPNGFIPNPNPNATIGVVNANTPFDPNNPQLQLQKCGRVEPILAAVQKLFANCACMNGSSTKPFDYYTFESSPTCSIGNPNANGVANMLDNIMRWLLAFVTKFSRIFPRQLIWPNCLCCGGIGNRKGIIWPLANVYVVGARQVVEFIRNLANPTYWSMNGGSLLDIPTVQTSQQGFVLSGLNFNLDDVRRTWINRFLAPFADAVCTLATNSACILSLVLGDVCESSRYMVVSSAVRYFLEYWIQLGAVIEGFIKLFANELPGLCIGGPAVEGNTGFDGPALNSQGSAGGYQMMVPTCSPIYGVTQPYSWKGLDPDKVGRMLVAFLQFLVDAFIGVSDLSCSALCPAQVKASNACNCYNLSPYRKWGDQPFDRCATAWQYFSAVNGWATIYGTAPQGQQNNYYPPGADPGFGWEGRACEKNTPCGAFSGPNCGDVCQFWFQCVWCATNWTINPAPGNPALCAQIIMAPYDSWSGQSMQAHYGGAQIWNYKSEESCPGANLNYCEATVPINFATLNPNIPPTVNLQAYIFGTIQHTTSTPAQVPNLVPANNTPYDINLCESNNYNTFYGTHYSQPNGVFSDLTNIVKGTNGGENLLSTNFAGPPYDPYWGVPQIKTTGPYLGACGWFEQHCTQSTIYESLKQMYGWANNIYMSDCCTAGNLNPWQFCCWANRGTTNWTDAVFNSNFTNLTVSQIACIEAAVGQPFSTLLVQQCLNLTNPTCNDPRYFWYGYISKTTYACRNQYNDATGVVLAMRTLVRNCYYAGIGAYDVSYLKADLIFAAANAAASQCIGVPSFCQQGLPAAQPNLNILDAYGISNLMGGDDTRRFQEYVDFRYVGQCARCRLEANGTCAVNGIRPPQFQPVCDRISCLAQGFCKNDLMVPCNAISNPAILDGAIYAALTYLQCLSERIFGAGGGVSNLFGIVRTVVRFFWQISGALIRLVVTLVLVILDIFVTFLNSLNLTGSFLDVLINAVLGPLKIAIIAFQHFSAVFNAFIAIFQQPLVRRGMGGADLGLENQFLQTLNQAAYFDTASQCVSGDIIRCICGSLRLRPFCWIMGGTLMAENLRHLTTNDVIRKTQEYFGRGYTTCDIVWDQLVAMDIRDWVSDVPFALRVQAAECITKRSEGDALGQASGDIFPKDFFYNPKSMFTTILGLFGRYSANTYRMIKRDHEQINGDRFKETFKMDRDRYYHAINLHSYHVQDFLKEKYGMSKDSLAWDFILKANMHYFKYQSGYYHMLWNNMTLSSYFGGRVRERTHHFWGAVENLKNVTDDVVYTIKDNFGDVVRDLPMPETPQAIRMIMDGSLYNAIALRFPTWNGIHVRMDKAAFRFEKPLPWNWEYQWTPQMLRVWEAGQRFWYGVVHTVAPHYVKQEHYERFILNGNCTLYDGFVTVGTNIIDYCVNEFVENTPQTRTLLGDYLAKTSHLRKGSFFRNHRGQITWEKHHHSGYVRARLNTTSFGETLKRIVVHKHVYKRATSANFGWLAQTLIDFIDNLFGIDLIQTFDNFITDFTNWVNNPNTDVADYPNVGARYWFAFLVRCEFPENLNCSLGIGLNNALWQVGVPYIIAFAILAFAFPQILSFISIVFNLFIYLVIVAIVAWHYSPACIWLFPATQLSSGITIPVLPIPLNIFPALPFCLWDDIISVLDAVFASCYTWIPQALLDSPQCVTCPDKLAFVSCADVGILTPLDVTLYWGYRFFGASFCDGARWIGNMLSFLPGLTSDTATTCLALQTASPTQADRQLACAIFSIGSLAWIAFIIYVFGALVYCVLLALINILHALLLLFPTIWIYDLVTTAHEPSGGFAIEGDNERRVPQDAIDDNVALDNLPLLPEERPPALPPGAGLQDRLAGFLGRMFLPKVKTE
jgi:hypothetical protein